MFRSIPLYEGYSLVFLSVAGIYIIAGTYTLLLNIKSTLNKAFYYVSISLAFWAFCYSLVNSAVSYEEAILWNRMSVLGWGLMYSILLHYFLILTERETFLSLKFSYVLIYLPSLVNLFVFGINSATVHSQFELLKTNAGWVNISENSFFDWYFYGYYLLNSSISLWLIWTWKRVRHEKKVRSTAIVVSISFFIGVTIGSITDVLLRQSMQEMRPQLGVVFALIPIFGVLYSIKKHGNMEERYHEIDDQSGRLLTQRKRLHFYKMLASVFVVSSLGYFILDYFVFAKAINGVILFTGFVFSVGVYIWMLPDLQLSERAQELRLGVLLAFVVPVLHLHSSQYGYNSVIWSVPIILIVLSTVTHEKTVLISVLASGVISEVFYIVKKQSFTATIGIGDYQQRLVVYVVLSFIIYFISHLYRQRLHESEEQTALQKEISEISSEFVSVNIDNFGMKLNDMLRRLGSFFNSERAYLYNCSKEMTVADHANDWCVEGMGPVVDQVDSLPREIRSTRQQHRIQENKSSILVPLFNQDEVIGYLRLDAVKGERTWSVEHKEALQIMANIVSDAIVKVEAEKEINYMAYFDALTGLSNRTYFNLQLEKMIELSKRKEKLLGILFLDLDEFKSINDTMGHETGDKLLVTIGKRLLEVVRKADVVCRFGGDEFLVMLPQMDDIHQIETATEKVMGVFQEAIIINDQNLHMTVSCGVAVHPLDGQDAVSLIKSADLAMYESKNSGKNRYSFCTPIMKEAVEEKIQLTNDLYRALEREELMLYYQPQVNIESGNIIGLEALIRWNHPSRGLVSPGQFIPLAEETGLIHKIGAWVLKTACMQNKAWQAKGYTPVIMAVNLSVEQFRDSRLVGIISEALVESELEPRYLELEITEGIAIRESSQIIGLLHQIKALGVYISIDDFGTEYSSLSRLKELPIDRLKMAKEFVQGIDKGTKDEAIALVIINLAKSLGLKVIAEGVEEEGQFAFLKDRVCDEVQGFYFYRPMPAEDIEEIMKVGDFNRYTS